MNKVKELKKIYDEVLVLKKSPLYKYRIENNYFPVIGEGSPDAKIMFIGEAPGKNEAITGKPFIGAAGKILDTLFDSIKLTREEIYVTSIVKDRPQKNRDPKPAEIEIYAPFLDRQIEIIQPKIIATLGRFAMDYVMRKYGLEDKIEPIGKLHGKTFQAKASYGPITIAVLYHPSVAIYNRNTLGALKKDFKILMGVIS